MSTLVVSVQTRFQPKALPMQAPFGVAHQIRLPFEGVRQFGVIVGGLLRKVTRRRPNGIIYFGNRRQFVAIGTTVRRVEG